MGMTQNLEASLCQIGIIAVIKMNRVLYQCNSVKNKLHLWIIGSLSVKPLFLFHVDHHSWSQGMPMIPGSHVSVVAVCQSSQYFHDCKTSKYPLFHSPLVFCGTWFQKIMLPIRIKESQYPAVRRNLSHIPPTKLISSLNIHAVLLNLWVPPHMYLMLPLQFPPNPKNDNGRCSETKWAWSEPKYNTTNKQETKNEIRSPYPFHLNNETIQSSSLFLLLNSICTSATRPWILLFRCIRTRGALNVQKSQF